ncbi:SDR family NAD(P)-dependent oxidoreductase [Corynebacterium crudilactis]|uniref:Oxidoreductase n=1 Tax=Corynebacterium crudilactis TaxID=1652495 RepID=A0A172QVJ2_9CORY|nr:SDR family oxidoreductase [Corynebacterium crudilactis]ANE04648.1 oxidoreductase [Corynebacterium crudilactis]
MSKAPSDLYPGAVLITGGGSGLGLEIARTLVQDSRPVIITGRDVKKLEQAAQSLGPLCTYSICDASDEKSVQQLGQDLAGTPISVLINNAGVGGPVKPLIELSTAEWDEVFDINVKGTFLMCREFAPQMVKRKNGFILNVASVTGKRPLENRTPYASSKMAVLGLTTTLAFELSKDQVMVNSLSPGPIVSERMTRNFRNEAELSGRTATEVEQEFVSRAALKRMVTLEETAQAAAALLSIPGLTGSDFDFSGGMIA